MGSAASIENDRLLSACQSGDLAAAQTAISQGARASYRFSPADEPYFGLTDEPAPVRLISVLTPATEAGNRELVVHLLSLGAAANDTDAMKAAVCRGFTDILEVLLDAGGGDDASSLRIAFLEDLRQARPLFTRPVATAARLLAEPTLDLGPNGGMPALEELAVKRNNHVVAQLIRDEVRDGCIS